MVNKSAAQYIQTLHVSKCSKCICCCQVGCWAQLSTAHVTAADFSGTFSPTRVYLVLPNSSKIFLIRSETCALNTNEIIMVKSLKKHMEHSYFKKTLACTFSCHTKVHGKRTTVEQVLSKSFLILSYITT